MTLDTFINTQRRKIARNFALRNQTGLSGLHHRKAQQQHRKAIRHTIKSVRLAQNPGTQGFIQDQIKWIVS